MTVIISTNEKMLRMLVEPSGTLMAWKGQREGLCSEREGVRGGVSLKGWDMKGFFQE